MLIKNISFEITFCIKEKSLSFKQAPCDGNLKRCKLNSPMIAQTPAL